MDLDFIKVGKSHMKHFTAQDEALLINDVIYIKGPTNQLLRIKLSEDATEDIKYNTTIIDTINLPIGAPGEESIISTVSPIYRVGNLDVDVDGKKVIPQQML